MILLYNNLHIKGKVVMMYAVEDGPCHQSFGVHVAGRLGIYKTRHL